MRELVIFGVWTRSPCPAIRFAVIESNQAPRRCANTDGFELVLVGEAGQSVAKAPTDLWDIDVPAWTRARRRSYRRSEALGGLNTACTMR